VKEQRLALELASATRERDFYLKQVDQGKAIDAMAAKQQRRAQQAAEAAEGGAAADAAQEPPRAKAGGARVVRNFQQARC
jgi:ESF2/ABP1 family protein